MKLAIATAAAGASFADLARVTVGVAPLPRGAAVEIDAIVHLPPPKSGD